MVLGVTHHIWSVDEHGYISDYSRPLGLFPIMSILIFAVCCLILSGWFSNSAVEWVRADTNTKEPRWGDQGCNGN